MKISYNGKVDIATIELGCQKIDHAQEAENVILHLSKDDDPVLLEILDASNFLKNLRTYVY